MLHTHTNVLRGGDDGEGVQAVVVAEQIPCDVSHGVALVLHVKRAAGLHVGDLPMVVVAKGGDGGPAALGEHGFQAARMGVGDD